MRWNLRLAAANRGIWKASELQHLLADHGLVISAGKMSHLWSGQPASLKLDDLDIICAALGCEIGEHVDPRAGQGDPARRSGARRGGCLGRAPGAGGPAPA